VLNLIHFDLTLNKPADFVLKLMPVISHEKLPTSLKRFKTYFLFNYKKNVKYYWACTFAYGKWNKINLRLLPDAHYKNPMDEYFIVLNLQNRLELSVRDV